MVETRTGGEVEEDVGEDDQEVVAVTGVEEVVAETVDHVVAAAERKSSS